MPTTTEHPLLRTHRLITQGAAPAPQDPATAAVLTMATNLQQLAQTAHMRRPTRLHIAPPRPNLHEQLSNAATAAKSFTRA